MARRLALALVVAVACAGCAEDSRRALHVLGDQLVDGQGRPLRLLGVNRSGGEYACVGGHGFFAGPTGKRAIAAMTSWRINSVRVPLNEHCWLGVNGAPARYSASRYRRAVKAYVARLHRAGLYVVLDLHWSAPGDARAEGQQPMADFDHAPAFWTGVARTFRDDPAVVFDLYNEPYDISWRCWRDGCLQPEGWRSAGMQELVDAVRSTGALQPIIATGPAWGSDLSSWLEYRPHDPANQLVAGLHVFDFAGCASLSCWAEDVQPVARRVPVVATELGERECSGRFMDRFLGWADSAGVSYLGWSWNVFGCEGPALVHSWDGRPTVPGARLRAHLRRLDWNRAGTTPGQDRANGMSAVWR
jgi:endoglucanase